VHDDSPKIKYSREQLIAALAAEYEYMSNQGALKRIAPVSEYIVQLNKFSDEQLIIATETDGNEFALDEFMSRYL
jgi:hypothetical protein